MLSLLSTPGLSLKLVRPKALLDNCFRVMELLYCSCCKEAPWVGWATVGHGDLGPGLWAECALSWECSLFLIDRLFLEAAIGLGYGECVVWLFCPTVLFAFCLSGKQSPILKWQDCELPSLHSHGPGSLMQCAATHVYPLPQQPPTSLPGPPGSSHDPLP